MIGGESHITDMSQGRIVPLLQDISSADIVTRYGLAKDDLVIVDRAGKLWVRQPTGPSFNFYSEPGISQLEAWLKSVP
jgi:hypothetical protein